jgi:hypothetical protein
MVIASSKINALFKIVTTYMLTIVLPWGHNMFYFTFFINDFFNGLWSLWFLCRYRTYVELVYDIGVGYFDHVGWNFFVALEVHLNFFHILALEGPSTITTNNGWRWSLNIFNIVVYIIPNFSTTHFEVRFTTCLELQLTQNNPQILKHHV